MGEIPKQWQGEPYKSELTPEWEAWVAKVAPGENVHSLNVAGKWYAVVWPPDFRPGPTSLSALKGGDKVSYITLEGKRHTLTVPNKEAIENLFNLFQKFMGLGGGRVKAFPDADSILEPGQTCVMSEPLDKYLDWETFLDEISTFMREPLFPMEEMVLKEVKCEDIGENMFTVKVVHDRDKWNRFGMRIPENAPELVRTWYSCKANYKERRFETVDHGLQGPPNDVGHSTTYFHKDPFRIEFWITMADGHRMTGKFVADYCQNFFINPIICRVQKRIAKILPESDSIVDEGEKSVLTEGLDEVCNYDEVYDGIMEDFKAGFKQSLPGVEDQIDEPDEHTLVMTMNKSAFENWQLMDPETRPKRPPMSMTMTIEHNREECYMNMTNVFGDSEPVRTFVRLHQCPLRVEFWMVNNGQRNASRNLGMRLQAILDGIISRAEGGWFW